MTNLSRIFALLFTFLSLPASALGDVSVSDLFADHMVLQGGVPIGIWGRATPGENVTVALNGLTAAAQATANGKWIVSLPALNAGGPYTLAIAGKNRMEIRDVLIGEVWLASGQSNMGMWLYPKVPYTHGVTDYKAEIAAANHPTLRFFTTYNEASETPKDEIHGVWQLCTPETAANFSAVAYYFGQMLNAKLNRPVGIVISSVGSTSILSWLDLEHAGQLPQGLKGLASAAKKRQEAGEKMNEYRASLPAYYEQARKDRTTPGKMTSSPKPYNDFILQTSGCYNAMIAPLTNLRIKGFVWYQGESDNSWAAGYTKAFETLIQTWRGVWREPDAPFLFVQISANDYYESHPKSDRSQPIPANVVDNWPKQRLAQAGALELPRTGMAVSCDFGDHTTSHYPDKKPVGERLALIALKMQYGFQIQDRGPVAGKVSVKGHSLVIPFETGGHLQGKGDATLSGFEVAGADRVFHPAHAIIEGGAVVADSPLVQSPTLVRYGWDQYPAMSLYDSEGLPAPPFVREVSNDHAELDAIAGR